MTTDLPDLSETLRWVRGHADAVRDPVTSDDARQWHTERLLERVEELDTWLSQGIHDVALPRDWDRAVRRDVRGTDRVRANDATHPRELPEPDPGPRLVDALDPDVVAALREPDRHASVGTLEAAITAGELLRRKLAGEC